MGLVPAWPSADVGVSGRPGLSAAREVAGYFGRLGSCRAVGCASSGDGAFGGAQLSGDVADRGAAGGEAADGLVLFGGGEVLRKIRRTSWRR